MWNEWWIWIQIQRDITQLKKCPDKIKEKEEMKWRNNRATTRRSSHPSTSEIRIKASFYRAGPILFLQNKIPPVSSLQLSSTHTLALYHLHSALSQPNDVSANILGQGREVSLYLYEPIRGNCLSISFLSQSHETGTSSLCHTSRYDVYFLWT